MPHSEPTAEPALVDDFDLFVARVRAQVEGRLTAFAEARVIEARHRGPDVEIVADAVRQLTLRGGKRMRAVLVAGAYCACGGQGGTEAVAPAGAALELLQTYLLVHDDWMDGDDVRRGGPSVPAMMRARFDETRADAMSILAGDLAAAWARRAIFDAAADDGCIVRAAAELARIEEDVVEGQVLDVGGRAKDAREVEAMHLLKTSSYTVRGPIVVGARLAGAPESLVDALSAFADPLGVAFQLRDDLLGVFGDAEAMGKPAGNDLRAGKRSAVVVDAIAHQLSAVMEPVLGRADASDDEVRAAVAQLEASGVHTRIEKRIDTLVREAQFALERTALTSTGRKLLSSAVQALTHRRS